LLQKIELTLKLKKESVPQNINFVYTLPEDSLRYIIKTKNPEVFYLINVREATLNIYGYDLKLLNAKEIPISQ